MNTNNSSCYYHCLSQPCSHFQPQNTMRRAIMPVDYLRWFTSTASYPRLAIWPSGPTLLSKHHDHGLQLMASNSTGGSLNPTNYPQTPLEDPNSPPSNLHPIPGPHDSALMAHARHKPHSNHEKKREHRAPHCMTNIPHSALLICRVCGAR